MLGPKTKEKYRKTFEGEVYNVDNILRVRYFHYETGQRLSYSAGFGPGVDPGSRIVLEGVRVSWDGDSHPDDECTNWYVLTVEPDDEGEPGHWDARVEPVREEN